MGAVKVKYFLGTIDLVTFTYKGVESIPSKIHKNVFKLMKKTDTKNPSQPHHQWVLNIWFYCNEKYCLLLKGKPTGVEGKWEGGPFPF